MTNLYGSGYFTDALLRDPPAIVITDNDNMDIADHGGCATDFPSNRIIVSPFGYNSFGQNTRYPWVAIIGHEGGHYVTRSRMIQKYGKQTPHGFGIVLGGGCIDFVLLQTYMQALEEALAYGMEERVLNQFTDDNGEKAVESRIAKAIDFRGCLDSDHEPVDLLVARDIWESKLAARKPKRIADVTDAFKPPKAEYEISREFVDMLKRYNAGY